MKVELKLRIELLSNNFRHSHCAVGIAEQFEKDYGDRVGRYHGVVYKTKCGCLTTHNLSFWAYKTEAGVLTVKEI